MDNILSQNRYAYVGNNPINYADPDGHKAVGSTIKNTASAMAANTRKAAQEKAAHSQAKADFVSMPLDALNSAGAWLDKRLTNLAGYIDASWAGEWAGSAAEWVAQKECAAYNYCIN